VGLLGFLTALDPQGFPEVVGTLGNSTRAGAFLALGVTAACASLAAPDAREPRWRERLASAALTLGSAALLLTRARGGWLAAAAGVAAVAWLSRRRLALTWKTCAVPLAVGAVLALVLGDGARLLAPKLERDTALLSAQDATAGVRLAVWRGTLRMVAEAPLAGHGLGLFRREFPAFREPEEAALPGREGLPTEVDHPHNELLLPLAEGGLPAGLCLLAFLALTLARAQRRAAARGADEPADGGLSDRVALGLLVAGGLAGMLQNAWTTPGTALPFFAAAGWAWRPVAAPAAASPGARAATRALLALLVAGLLLLALPRARTHVQWWRFFRDADAHGVNLDNVALLADAADASPGDVDIQARLAHFAEEIQAQAPQVAGAVQAPLDRARARLSRLRPPR
jgi:O-antigen ligase